MRRIAENVVLVFVARWGMALTGALFPIVATVFYNGQVEVRKSLDDIKIELARLSTTQQLAGESRDRAITALDGRLTYIERQARK
jgi:hypothetical protein